MAHRTRSPPPLALAFGCMKAMELAIGLKKKRVRRHKIKTAQVRIIGRRWKVTAGRKRTVSKMARAFAAVAAIFGKRRFVSGNRDLRRNF